MLSITGAVIDHNWESLQLAEDAGRRCYVGEWVLLNVQEGLGHLRVGLPSVPTCLLAFTKEGRCSVTTGESMETW